MVSQTLLIHDKKNGILTGEQAFINYMMRSILDTYYIRD